MDWSGLHRFFSKYWFKLVIGLVLLFIVLKKDLSFQINLKAPVRQEKELPRDQVPVQEPPDRPPEERLSERGSAEEPAVEGGQPEVDRFDFSGIRSSSKKRAAAMNELESVSEDKRRAFMNRFAHLAVSERKKYGIPSSLIMANALLASRSGQRDLTRSSNNYFALKCTPDWTGAQESYQGSCYRAYENAWTSFRDHSLFLTTGPLTSLRRLYPDDYKAWARELEKQGFYEEPDMARQVIEVIEAYRLYELDR
jgi:hypothetical protein